MTHACGRRQGGFALIIVLWSVVLLSAVAATMVASARTDLQLARNLRGAAAVEALADGAVYRAAFHLIDGGPPWPTDGRPIDAGSNGIGIAVCIRDEAGKINPNTASPELIAALLHSLEADRATAQRLAAAIFGWRDAAAAKVQAAAYRAAGLTYEPPGAAFLSADEVRLVLGMTPALFEALRPNLSVWPTGEPNPRAATPAVLAALRLLLGAAPAVPAGGVPNTVAITVLATVADGVRFARNAVVRVAADSEPTILSWTQGGPETRCGR